MKLIFSEYWNKLTPDASAPFGKRVVSDEYEPKGTSTIENSGWPTSEAWAANTQTLASFTHFDDKGRAVHDLRTHRGRHMYQTVECVNTKG